MSKLDIVITMGGLGKRFRDVGYTVPKYMISVKGKSLFEWAMISLDNFREHAEQYIFIAMADDSVDVLGFIEEKCMELRISNFHVIVLDHLTDGQATTAMMAEKYWNKSNGLLIYNIDTYVEPGEMRFEELKGDGFIPCFSAPGDHWSFVRLDEAGKVVEIKEKKRISNHCTLGAYYFKTCNLFKTLYLEYYAKGYNGSTEKYVAPLYDYLLSCGGEIFISDVDSTKVHVLGTPDELNAFMDSEYYYEGK